MLGFSTYAALLPELRDAWGLSNSQAGVIGGNVLRRLHRHGLLWTALTDRVDARRVYLAGRCRRPRRAVSALRQSRQRGAFPGAVGAGIAATYMPGLRLLSDRIAGTASRAIAFYTSFFGIGVASFLYIAGLIAPALGLARGVLGRLLGPAAAGLRGGLAFIEPRRPARRRSIRAERALSG